MIIPLYPPLNNPSTQRLLHQATSCWTHPVQQWKKTTNNRDRYKWNIYRTHIQGNGNTPQLWFRLIPNNTWVDLGDGTRPELRGDVQWCPVNMAPDIPGLRSLTGTNCYWKSHCLSPNTHQLSVAIPSFSLTPCPYHLLLPHIWLCFRQEITAITMPHKLINPSSEWFR